MTLREEFENEIKSTKGGVSVLFEARNQQYIEWLESRCKEVSKLVSNGEMLRTVLQKLLEGNMCSHVGDEMIEEVLETTKTERE